MQLKLFVTLIFLLVLKRTLTYESVRYDHARIVWSGDSSYCVVEVDSNKVELIKLDDSMKREHHAMYTRLMERSEWTLYFIDGQYGEYYKIQNEKTGNYLAINREGGEYNVLTNRDHTSPDLLFNSWTLHKTSSGTAIKVFGDKNNFLNFEDQAFTASRRKLVISPVGLSFNIHELKPLIV